MIICALQKDSGRGGEGGERGGFLLVQKQFLNVIFSKTAAFISYVSNENY